MNGGIDLKEWGKIFYFGDDRKRRKLEEILR